MVTKAQPRLLFAGVLLLAASGCRPEIEGRPSLVEGERILAVRSTPAEAKPNTSVSYEALFVSPDGTLSGESLAWALCNERKPLTQSGTISNSCLVDEADVLQALGEGGAVTAMLPRTVCETFGPTPRTPKPGEPKFRPVDPDTTGGYYQPVRVLARAERALFADGMTRLACGLGGATQPQTAEFNRRYRPNENPRLDSLRLVRDDGSEALLDDAAGGEPPRVSREERVRLRADWSACPTTPSCGDGVCSSGETDCPGDCTGDAHGCTGSELYVNFDTSERALQERRESIRVSWFANAGRFEFERTGQPASEDPETSSENRWTAPADSGEVLFWVVMRDDRGGVAWTSYRVLVD